MHRILERQIKRFLENTETLPVAWKPFLDAVSDTYAHFDDDRALLERSLELSSKEFLENNQHLRETKEKIEDLVEQRTSELQYEKAKLYSVAQNITVGAFLLNGERDVVFINSVGRAMIGSPPSDKEAVTVLGQMFPILHLSDRIERCFEAKESSSIPEIDAEGHIYEILFRCVSTTDAAKQYSTGLLILIRDITGEKLLDRSKNEFVSIASHEMRTPLAIIRGNAELIRDALEGTSLPIPEIQKMISSIHGSTLRLLDIVNDFLDVTRLEGKQVQFKKEKFDITGPIREAVSEFGKLAAEKGLYLTFESTEEKWPEVLADPDRAEQVIANLLGNAIHYTDQGGIRVSIKNDIEFLRVLVSDTGIGIEKDKQKLLFQKFKTAGASFRHSKEYGSGLGLYIGKLLMESMGGKILLERSAPGEGSVFSISFPVAE